MLFSIIVPIYKVQKYINQCIDSVLAQTLTDFELILVDDGSPDGCGKICDEYAVEDNRIVVIHKENGGLVSARQVGAKAAKGNYVICLDGDDWIDKHYLETAEKIIKTQNPDLIVFDYRYGVEGKMKIVRSTKTYGMYNSLRIEKDVFPQILESSDGECFSPQLWAKVFRTELYREIQLKVDTHIDIGEDEAVTKPYLFRINSMYISREVVYNYRYNGDSLTKGRKVFNWDVPYLRMLNFEKQIDLSLFDFRSQLNRALTHMLFNVALSQFNKKEKYSVIREEIRQKLSEPYYNEAIAECKYKSLKAKIMAMVMKHRMIFLMRLINKLR